MANLVLGAVGGAVGGPIGSSIGSFVGRELDRTLFKRGGPRLNDMRAPTARYGDTIPKIFGKMRVAGVVLWTTSPVATATVSKSGTEPGSSVSFALGVSSGLVREVRRIWADGRLIRDASGRQEVPFTLRLHSGAEDQLSDSLIASVIGEDRAPAFRGLAYLLFEDFDLSTFGRRLPLITVELTGEELLGPEDVLSKTLALKSELGPPRYVLNGYALDGDHNLAAVSPLLAAFDPAFTFEDGGWTLQQSSAHHIVDERLWNLAYAERATDVPDAEETPTRVSVRYFDPAIDFAAGEKSARLQGRERIKRIELPAAMTSSSAKALAFEELARVSATCLRSWLNLPLSFAHMNVGDQLSCAASPEDRYVICEKAFRSGHVRLVVRKHRQPIEALFASEPGGIAGDAELERHSLALTVIELPGDTSESKPKVAFAASGGSVPFRALPIVVSAGGREEQIISADHAIPPGRLINALPPSISELLDRQNSIEVSFERETLLTSCDEMSLLSGANLLSVNGELIQFGIAEAISSSSFRLSELIRGRHDTQVTEPHEAGALVTILTPGTYHSLDLPRESIGSLLKAKVHGPEFSSVEALLEVTAFSIRPWAPAHLTIHEDEVGLRLSWVRRGKEGLPWMDNVDTPLSEGREAYSIRLQDEHGGLIEHESDAPSILLAKDVLQQLGPRPWRLEVRQLGEFAAGKPLSQLIH